MTDIANPKRTREILDKYDLRAKKSLGQNFLIDKNILDKIVETAGVDKGTNVIEVGPGIGALTEQLAKKAKKVLAFEIDQRFIQVLEDTLSPYDNVEVINQDVLEADLEAAVKDHFEGGEKLVLVANLPYYVTTPIILHFLESNLKLDSMTVMVQKEVGARISAKENTKAYGSLSIAIQYYMDAEMAFQVPRTVFNPPPNVDSAIIHLSRKEEAPVQVADEELFFRLIRASFKQRRKTLRNNLIHEFGKTDEVKDSLEKASQASGIDLSRRGESLTIEDFASLANALSSNGFTA